MDVSEISKTKKFHEFLGFTGFFHNQLIEYELLDNDAKSN
jgi:hypothetical protein